MYKVDSSKKSSQKQPLIPSELTLFEPTVSPSNNATPTIAVLGTEAGTIINIYSDSSCTHLVGSGTAVSVPALIKLNSLTAGSYKFYAGASYEDGNLSSCSTASVDYVLIQTTVALTSPSSTVVQGLFSVTATFSDSVTGFDLSQVVVTNGNPSNFSGSGNTYSFDVTPTAEGNTTISIANGIITDPLGNTYSGSTSLVRYHDKDTVKVNFSEIDSAVIEQTLAKTVNVTLNAAKPYPITVKLGLFGDALFGTDMDLNSTSIVIPANQTTASLNFNFLNNASAQAERTLGIFALKTSSNRAVPGITSFTRQHIRDDDSGVSRTVSMVSAGGTHTCSILSDGVLKCWGNNGSGQIGDGTLINKTTPTIINSGTSYLRVSSGTNSTCAITTSGVLYCWGSNGYGQLGDGSYTNRANPVIINSGTSYSEVSTGGSAHYAYHSCGITTAGVLKCWGDNSYGQLGDGTYNTSLTPIIIDSGTTYKKISTNSVRSCGITTSDVLKCWGGWYVGDGTLNESLLPKVVDSGTAFAEVSVAEESVCAITIGGILKCWGYNYYTNLGGSASEYLSPQIVDSGTLYSKVQAGESYTCGITTTGTMKCLGSDSLGELGQGSINNDGSTPLVVDADERYVAVSGDATWSGGGNSSHVCGITLNGNLKCWGLYYYADYAQSGYTGTSYNTPQLVANNGVTFLDIATSFTNTCGIDSEKSLLCWGQFLETTKKFQSKPAIYDVNNTYDKVFVNNNNSGNNFNGCAITTDSKLMCWGAYLGDGSTASATTPTAVDAAVNYSKVTVGNSHRCAITTAGVLKCWGINTLGQLGDGTLVAKTIPTIIDAGVSYIDVQSKGNHTCAITNANKLKCWGDNSTGQLGIGSTTSSSNPQPVDASVDYAQVSTSSYHTCAITTGTGLKCWGSNSNGRLGDGTTTQKLSPVVIAGAYAFVSAGGSSTCAILSTGVLRCWGDNMYGTVGNGTYTQSLSPTTIDSGTNYSKVSVDGDTACGITSTTNLVKCWGRNQFATIGSGANPYLPSYVKNLIP